MRPIIAPALLVLFLGAPLQADWPQFRGPDGRGRSDAKTIPLRWSETESVT